MNLAEVEKIYEERYEDALRSISAKLEKFIRDHLTYLPRIDAVKVRAKSIEKFIEKAKRVENGILKYSDPINQIQDQIGARVVTFYLNDVEPIAEEMKRYFRAIEEKDVFPESDSEFGYFGKHYIFFLPRDVTDGEPTDKCPKYFEFQIKTLFQHAWSEANHDLGYKPNSGLSSEQRRKIAFTSAQAWGADHMFDELFLEMGKGFKKFPKSEEN